MSKKLKNIVIPREVKIRVTRKDIDTGVFGDTRTCAIAKAVKARLGDHPSVYEEEIEVTLPCRTIAAFMVPLSAKEFIRKFDAIDEVWDDTRSPKKLEALKRKARKALKPFTFVAKLVYAEVNV